MHADTVVEALAAFPLFAEVPRAELAWMVERGTTERFTHDAIVRELGAALDDMWFVLSGRLAVHLQKGGSWRTYYDRGPGSVIGAMPFSRLRTAPGRLVVEEDTLLLALNRQHFTDLVHQCPELTAALVHHMVDRARNHQTAQLHDERMQSLGRLAAGLAHELNNPASGAASHARSLAHLLDDVSNAAIALTRARLTDEQLDTIEALRHSCTSAAPSLSAIDLADREEAFSEWMQHHQVEAQVEQTLAASAVSVESLDRLASTVPANLLTAAIRWAAGDVALREAATDITLATSRIHNLVSAVKGFTFMDREGVPSDVDIARGLADTVAMLETKSRGKSVHVRVDTAPDLPGIHAFGSELNQVWEKLIDNAIDAVPENGSVTVTATRRGDFVVVCIADDGPGIAEEHRARIFDPFFTTKPVGSGTGLGLDIARRYVHLNAGDLNFSTRPGNTEFRVRLPVDGLKSV